MASKHNLMALGMSPFLANIIGRGALGITTQGASNVSATLMGNTEFNYFVNATNNGNYLQLPQIGGDPGCLLGDVIYVTNTLAASVVVAASSASLQIIGAGAATSGSLGVSIPANTQSQFIPISASTWSYK